MIKAYEFWVHRCQMVESHEPVAKKLCKEEAQFLNLPKVTLDEKAFRYLKPQLFPLRFEELRFESILFEKIHDERGCYGN